MHHITGLLAVFRYAFEASFFLIEQPPAFYGPEVERQMRGHVTATFDERTDHVTCLVVSGPRWPGYAPLSLRFRSTDSIAWASAYWAHRNSAGK